MKKIITFMIVMMCAACLGSTVFVNPASTDDTGDGSTNVAGSGGTSAKQTIDGAWIEATSGDTIKLVAGTYDDSAGSQGANWGLDFDLDKTIIIEPETAGTEVNLTLGVIAQGVELTTALSSKTITFNDINFNFDACTSYGFLVSGASASSNLVLDNCDMQLNNGTFIAGIRIAAAWNDITIQNGCNLTVERTANSTGDGQFLELRAALGTITVKDSQVHCLTSVAGGNNTHDNYVWDFLVAGTGVNNVIFINSQFSSTNSIVNNYFGNAYPGIVNQFFADNCTFTNLTTNAASSFPILGLGQDVVDITDWANSTAYTVGNIRDNGSKIYRCVEAHTSTQATDEPGVGTAWEARWILDKTFKVVVQNCTVTTDSTARAHGIFLGGQIEGALIKDNTVYDNNWQIVVKGGLNTIIGNETRGNNCLTSMTYDRNIFLNNTAYCDTGFALALSGDDGTNFGSYSIVTGNILYCTSAGTNVFTDNAGDGAAGDDYNHYVNWNSVFSENATNWYILQATSPDTLALAQTQWGVQSDHFGSINDQNSLDVDPQFINPTAVPPDLKLKTSSPLLNTAEDGSTFGSWQPWASPNPTNPRARYSGQSIYN